MRNVDPASIILERSIPVTECGCWIWMAGCASTGYGRVEYRCRRYGAHRFSYETFKGPVPAGLHVLHRCDMPLCVNPEHLFLGTNADNIRDRDAKGRSNRARGERQGAAKLSVDAVVDIRTSPLTRKALAAKYGVHHTTITAVLTGRTWLHVRHESGGRPDAMPDADRPPLLSSRAQEGAMQ